MLLVERIFKLCAPSAAIEVTNGGSATRSRSAHALQDDIQRRQADDILDRMLQDPTFREQFIEKLRDVLSNKNTTAGLGSRA